jgi:D-glycero-alpha-D-manno-heptose 1-phosphate guanylyltransferase
MNGDSYLQVDFKKMEVFHNQRMSDITIASYFISPADRYGVMQVNEEFEIELFKEKGKCDQGIINGGVYILNVESLNRIFSSIKNSSFSFEDVVLANQCNKLKKFHFQTDGYFLDIGIPADFEKAQKELFI